MSKYNEYLLFYCVNALSFARSFIKSDHSAQHSAANQLEGQGVFGKDRSLKKKWGKKTNEV